MKLIVSSSLAFFFLLISGFSVLFAQKPSASKDLDEVLIHGNRLNIPFSESTSEIQVLTAEDIAQYPVHTLNELLAYVGGVDLQQRGPFGAQADISIDGGTFEQTLLLLNGIKMMDDQTAHHMLNLPIPLIAIEQIEILRGSAARAYGINALSGAVNIVTKKNVPTQLSTDIYLGSSLQEKVEGDGSGLYGGGGLQLMGQWAATKHRQLLALSQDFTNGQRYNTAGTNSKLFYNGAYNFNKQHSIEAIASFIHNQFGANGFYAAPGDKESEEVVQTALFSLASKHHFGQLKISPRVSYRHNKDDYRYFRNDLSKARSIHSTKALLGELNGQLSTDIGQFGLGFELRQADIESSNIGHHHRNNTGFYTEYQSHFSEKWLTNMGLYLNYNSDYGWQLFPGMDVAYLFNSRWKIAAGFGSGQRIPSFTDLYLNQLPGNIGNPNLHSERGWQYHLDLQHQAEDYQVKVGVFYRDISDFIDWVREEEQQPFSPVNYGHNRLIGSFIRASKTWNINEHHRLRGQLQYHYLHPNLTDQYSDKQSKFVAESLKHQLIFGLMYQYRNWQFYVTDRYLKRELNQAYQILDLKINYRLKPFTLYLSGQNLLNSQYKEIAAVPILPRWISLGAKLNFIKE